MSYRKLTRKSGPRKALLRNMAESLIQYEQITTTTAKAKELKKFIENIISSAKPGSLASMRNSMRDIQNVEARKKLFSVLVARYKDRNGGYTRVFRTGTRRGDASSMALIKLVQ